MRKSTPKLKICFLGNASVIHTIKWASYFSKRGHQVYLFSFDPPEENLKGINFYLIKKTIPTPSNIAVNPLYTLINIIFGSRRVKKIIKEIKPDVINAHYISSYGFLAILTGFHPVILTAWGSDILINPQRNFIFKKLTQRLLKKADLITCDADHMKKAIIKLGTPREKIKIIFFGVDTKKFSPGEKNKEIIGKFELVDKTVISLKWLDPLSDIETIIKAAKIVIKKYPESRFLLVGPTSFPDYLQKLKKMVKNLKLEKQVKFVGPVSAEKIPNYLRTSDIYVCTSLSDAGLASSTAEAMACGLPVITVDFGNNTDWVKNGKNGFLIPLKNYKLLADKIIYLFENKEVGKNLGRLARQTIKERNDYYKEMAKMEKIYYQLSKN